MKYISCILTLLVFILPLIVFPWSISPYEIPKVLIAEVGIAIIIFLNLFQNRIKVANKIIILVGSIVGLSFIHLLFFHSSMIFFGNPIRMQGIFLLWNLLALSVVSSQVSLPKPVSGIAIISGIVLIGSIVLHPITVNERFVGTLGEPNTLAAVAVFFWPFIFSSGEKSKKLLAIIFAVIVIFLSGSRSGLVAFGIQLFFLCLIHFKKSVVTSFCIALFLLGISLVLPYFEQTAYQNRQEIWRIALASGFAKPILGWGFGNTEIALANTAERLNSVVATLYVDSAHNFLLDWLVQGGILGLGLLLIFIWLAIKNYLLKKQILELTLLLGVMTSMSFNPVSVVTLIVFWWLIGNSFLKKSKNSAK